MNAAQSKTFAPNIRPDSTAELTAALNQRIMVIDGAMGTAIQRDRPDEAGYRGERFKDWPSDLIGNNDLLTLTQPDIIEGIHREYLEAGADILETNTFNANAVSLSDYGMEELAYELNYAGAALARQACDEFSTPEKPRYVAGALGPTTRTASISPDVNDPGARNVSYDQLVAAYLDAAKGLVDGGSDLLIVETIFDTLNAKAAVFAIETLFEERGRRWPVIISGTITDASGRTLSGQVTEAFWNAIRHAKPLAVGLNCALGAPEMRPYIAEMARIADTYEGFADRGEKLAHYKRIPSLQEVVLVAHDEDRIDVWRRSTRGWTLHSFRPGQEVVLESLHGIRFPVDDVYLDRLAL